MVAGSMSPTDDSGMESLNQLLKRPWDPAPSLLSHRCVSIPNLIFWYYALYLLYNLIFGISHESRFNYLGS